MPKSDPSQSFGAATPPVASNHRRIGEEPDAAASRISDPVSTAFEGRTRQETPPAWGLVSYLEAWRSVEQHHIPSDAVLVSDPPEPMRERET